MLMSRQRQKAFTIVELLIVIVVIAILATISIVAYNGIQNRANDAAVEADIASIIKKMEIAKIDLGRYPRTLAEFPDGIKLSKAAYDVTQNNVYYIVDLVNDQYALGLRSKSLKGYIINSGSVASSSIVNGAWTVAVLPGLSTFETSPGVSVAIMGYQSATSSWHTTWSWTN